MSRKVRPAFAMDPVTVRLDQILPTRPFQEVVKQTSKYKTIAASVREVGIIEPLIVHPQKGGKYLLLDGHMRLQVLRDLEKEEALCIVSSDDESYTYNTKVSRLAPIQANRMIMKALDAGVSEERLARALSANVRETAPPPKFSVEDERSSSREFIHQLSPCSTLLDGSDGEGQATEVHRGVQAEDPQGGRRVRSRRARCSAPA